MGTRGWGQGRQGDKGTRQTRQTRQTRGQGERIITNDARCTAAGKPLRQSLMGETPKTALPYQRTGSPMPNAHVPTFPIPNSQFPIRKFQ
ncbi:hypothetical protein [Tolypothrix sp. VBCCA 56010]|uniref:hypothetical protein n=1 Tax=Tolypothrix sp. VBCCA 56010 TaxID=3137731 RepID=UPI003D7EBFFB